ncbi:anaerobic ribonucleoside-triphosphate reductase, partial [archaeon]
MEHKMPKVRRSDGLFVPWNREAIVSSLLKETKLARKFFGIPEISREEAEEIAKEVEKRIIKMELSFVSGPLIRELVNSILLEKSREKPHYRVYRNIYTRVGSPIYDAYLIDIGKGFEAKENANLQPNAETSHKKKADKLSKEEYLLLMPTHLADAHLSGDLHIHDLEYFGTRPFCQDWDLRYFFYYGFIPDGLGTRTSVAGPAKKPEVAVLHSVKVLAAAQTNFAGGEGFYNYLVFLAPYMEGLSFKRVKQLMQMMFFELTQMYVARGGQPVFS